MSNNTNLSWAARLALRGISRRKAAGALYLSQSALNKKLRGASAMTAQDEERLLALLKRGRKA
jgi:hypothetical protein